MAFISDPNRDVPKVLIVEDDPLTALELSHLLEDMGLEVCGMASTGPRGVALADHFRPDLVLLDLTLGKGTDGVSAARQMRRQLKLDVLLVTGRGPDEVGEILGDDLPMVAKPFAPDQVRRAVRTALERRAERDDRVPPPVPVTRSPNLPTFSAL